MKRRTGLKKPLRPSFLRHASLTEWAKILPEQKLKVLAGWTPVSRMAAVYIHLAGKDLDEDILKAHCKKLMEPEKLGPSPLTPKVCWRCGHENAATHVFCAHCGVVLGKKEAFKTVERETMPLDKIISEDKAEFLKLIRKATREELRVIVEDFIEPLKKEVKDAQNDIQATLKEHKRALREIESLKREVDKKLKD